MTKRTFWILLTAVGLTVPALGGECTIDCPADSLGACLKVDGNCLCSCEETAKKLAGAMEAILRKAHVSDALIEQTRTRITTASVGEQKVQVEDRETGKAYTLLLRVPSRVKARS